MTSPSEISPATRQTTALEDWNATRARLRLGVYGFCVYVAALFVGTRMHLPMPWTYTIGMFAWGVVNWMVDDRRKHGSVNLRRIEKGQLLWWCVCSFLIYGMSSFLERV